MTPLDKLNPQRDEPMKKVAAFFAALFLTFSVPTIPVVPAQMAALGPVAVTTSAPVPMPVAVVSPTLDRIGVVAAAGGKVELTTPGQAGRIAQSGQAIFLGDEVKTDAEGHLQILLLDETVFTIGPNSSIIIDKFVYDPKSHSGEIRANVAKGAFRYVSGKIAAKNPNSVKMKLPTATLGFRGTIVGGSVGANGQGLVGLLGPGNNNDSGAQNGSFSIDGTGGGHQDVNRTGFGVEVGADGGLSGVFQLSNDQINGLTGGLGGGQGGNGGSGGGAGSGGGGVGGGLGGNTDMGNLSGENNALTGGNVMFLNGLGGVTDNMNDVSTKGAQDALNSGGGGSVASGNTTTYEQLLAATTEPSHYAGSGSYSGGSGGYTSGQANIFFGPSGYIGGLNSNISVYDGSNTDSTSLGGSVGISFAGKSGPADFSWHETGAYGTFDITVTLTNSEGVTAQTATANVTYTNTNGELGPVSGTGVVTAELTSGSLAA